MRVENDLKPHNVEIIKQILEFYKTSNKCCAIQATGTGKTFLILRLLEIKAKRQDAALENMSDEDLDKALAELGE